MWLVVSVFLPRMAIPKGWLLRPDQADIGGNGRRETNAAHLFPKGHHDNPGETIPGNVTISPDGKSHAFPFDVNTPEPTKRPVSRIRQ
jgi:hypothetical protein